MTVTAPLDMGTGQQRYVVAYTLKQGIEKQPDILNAQKSMCIIMLKYFHVSVDFIADAHPFYSFEISIFLFEFHFVVVFLTFTHTHTQRRFREYALI